MNDSKTPKNKFTLNPHTGEFRIGGDDTIVKDFTLTYNKEPINMLENHKKTTEEIINNWPTPTLGDSVTSIVDYRGCDLYLTIYCGFAEMIEISLVGPYSNIHIKCQDVSYFVLKKKEITEELLKNSKHLSKYNLSKVIRYMEDIEEKWRQCSEINSMDVEVNIL